MNLAMCNLPSNMKSSSHKTWQTSLLFLKPLQIQNLKRKKVGEQGILYPPTWKSGGTRPPCSPPNCAHAYYNSPVWYVLNLYGKKIILLIAIEYFMFLFPFKDKSVRLLTRTRACTHLSITVVKLTVTYYVWFYVHS